MHSQATRHKLLEGARLYQVRSVVRLSLGLTDVCVHVCVRSHMRHASKRCSTKWLPKPIRTERSVLVGLKSARFLLAWEATCCYNAFWPASCDISFFSSWSRHALLRCLATMPLLLALLSTHNTHAHIASVHSLELA